MTTFTVSTIIDAPVDQVWATLTDIGSISAWNPGVKDSHLTSEVNAALGATRHCDLGGRNYLDEEVVEFAADETLTMRITKTNLPFQHADIRFRLEPRGQATHVTVSPEYRMRYGPVGSLMDRVMVRRTYEKGMRGLLRGLKRHVEAEIAAS